jgi:hypothetical protein
VSTVTKIQFRRGTAAAWASVNPILGDGEPGFTIDSRVLKIGDGTTAWADLTASADPDLIDQITDAVAAANQAADRAEAASGGGGGGGGAGTVTSVLGKSPDGSGLVTFTLDDVPDGSAGLKMTPAERAAVAAFPAQIAARVRASGAGVNGRYLGVLTANPDTATLQTGDWWILVSA